MTRSKRRPKDPQLRPSSFIARNPVFRFDEFLAAHPARTPATLKAILQHHVSTGRIWNIRRGLYTSGPVDPWVVGSKVTQDAVLAYDGALSFHQLAGEEYQITFLTEHQVRIFSYSDVQYTPARPPKALHQAWRTAVIEVERAGQVVRVTTVERTLVDMLDRIDLLRDEKASRNVDGLRGCFMKLHLDVDAMISHARSLNSRVLAARLGFFLEHMPYTRPSQLFDLDALRPPSPAYFDRAARDGVEMTYMLRWNLMVPKKLFLALRSPKPVKRRWA